ncbi:MAG: N-acetyltransferase [Peptococcaceae bacterium]|nr:N-acetyltransferase [Peptococcaceae bacterium]
MGNIRLAREEDAQEILNIYRPYIEDTAVSFETEVPTIVEIRRRIRCSLDNYCWLVWEEGGQIRGYAYASKHRERAAYRWAVDVSIYIDGHWHGKGVGKALYSSLFAILRLQGYFNLYACICLPHPKSVGIHEYFGFKKNAHFHQVGYKLGQWWDIGWWEMFLSDKSIVPGEPLSISKLDQNEVQRILAKPVT